jgi:hypothetical protein
MPDAYEKLPAKMRALLVSGMCISVTDLNLPDYSVLLYTDLRVLEGALLNCLVAYGLYPSNFTADRSSRVGVLYTKTSVGYALKTEHRDVINNAQMVSALESAYNMYYRKRHSLFHMEEIIGGSAVIGSIDRVMVLSQEIKYCINTLYRYVRD